MHEEEPTTSADIDPLQKPSFSMAAKESEAHPADVNCVRWNPQDPTLLASAGDEGSIRLWRYRRSASDQHVLNSRHNGTTTVPEAGM